MIDRWVIAYAIALLFWHQGMNAQESSEMVHVTGAMSNVMKKGQLEGTINLDTIQDKVNLFGLGPKEYLKGELLIIDGKSFVSSIEEDGSIKMEETFDVKAPFFVYANASNWREEALPEKVNTLSDLEQYIDAKTKAEKRPLLFKLKGIFTRVDFHIQNLPEGAVVKSSKDAHQGQGKFVRENVEGEIIGFFSTEHQTVFTHHDSFIHIHFINSEQTEMGHVDDLLLDGKEEVILYLPID